MFNNAGGKIKLVAVIITLCGIIASVIFGIVLMVKVSFLSGLLAAVGGSLVVYLSGLGTYGFGDLVASAHELAYGKKHTAEAEPVQEKPAMAVKPVSQAANSVPAAKAHSDEEPVGDGWKCACGRVNQKYVSTCVCGKNKREVEA